MHGMVPHVMWPVLKLDLHVINTLFAFYKSYLIK